MTRPVPRMRIAALLVVTVIAASAAACTEAPARPVDGGGQSVTVDDPERACATFVGMTVPAEKIGTPDMLRAPATVMSAVYQPASAAVFTEDLSPADDAGTSSAVQTPAKPAFCQITGNIAPVTEGAQPIGFQVNLPTEWNGNSAQFGGGGFNGELEDATGYINIDTNAGDVRTPLARGYVTVSTDSGHLTTASPRYNSPDPAERAGATFDFALHPEMFRNFATDAYKKVHDVGQEIAQVHYGERPRKRLWLGGSEGGREGLLMAQRFPGDIDGVFIRNPVIGWTGLASSGITTTQAIERQGAAGALTEADIDLLARTSVQTCDSQDGIADAVLSDYRGCQERILHAVHELRCPGEADPGICLTPAQLAVVDTVFTRLDLGFTLPSGLDHYPAFFVGGEDWSLADRIGDDPSLDYGDEDYPRYATFAIGTAKFVIAQDPALDAVNGFHLTDHQDRMAELAGMMDTLDPDLSAFAQRGGKLVVLECTADFAQSAGMGMEYHDSVVSTMGKEATEGFMRLYVSPGTDHGCAGTLDPTTLDGGRTSYGAETSDGTVNGVPRNVDWLGVIEGWVLEGAAPGNAVVATANAPGPPFQKLASKPICGYPQYPRYVGGDAALADSYRCAP
jgi:Tannase and feruloyl esterase